MRRGTNYVQLIIGIDSIPFVARAQPPKIIAAELDERSPIAILRAESIVEAAARESTRAMNANEGIRRRSSLSLIQHGAIFHAWSADDKDAGGKTRH